MKKALEKIPELLAVRKGLEPSTLGVTGRYSNQLNYRTNLTLFPSRGVFLVGIAKIVFFLHVPNFFTRFRRFFCVFSMIFKS